LVEGCGLEEEFAGVWWGLIQLVPRYTSFAYAEGRLNTSHKREEIETDLIGAYYLEVGEAPLAQFGHTENIPV
jgi:hypothetical protein